MDWRMRKYACIVAAIAVFLFAGCGGAEPKELVVDEGDGSGDSYTAEDENKKDDGLDDGISENEILSIDEEDEESDPITEAEIAAETEETEEYVGPNLEIVEGLEDINVDAEPEDEEQVVGNNNPEVPPPEVPLEDLSGYCGDELVFSNETQVQIPVSVDNYVDDENRHLLLPPIVLFLSKDVDAGTVTKEGVRFKVDDTIFDNVEITVEEVNDQIELTLNNINNKAWQPDQFYSIKLCHQIKTDGGIPIKPIEIVIQTRRPDKQETIDLSHSGGLRSGMFYLPKDFDPAQSYPLAVFLHGLGGNGSEMVGEFQSLADSFGVILLGPDGFARPNPFGAGTTYYFNPNYNNAAVEDYTFVINSIDRMFEAFDIDHSQVLVAGMSMGAPAILFFAGRISYFTHAAMLHGVRWNYDKGNKNDVANLLWFDWEVTPLGTYRPLFWYSTAVDDWVTNYNTMSIPGLSVEQDLAYIENGGYNVTHKFDYPGGHWMSAEEKEDLFSWFLLGIKP